MPASFAKDLCGYRDHGKPNTSDRSKKDSVALGIALFEALGVPHDAQGQDETGLPFATKVADDLRERVRAVGVLHRVQPEQALNEFQQYRHVGALNELAIEPSKGYLKAWKRLTLEVTRRVTGPPASVRRASAMIDDVEAAVAAEVDDRRRVVYEMGTESLLNLDVTVADAQYGRLPELEIGLSLKWSLRTDRAQDCRSQGAKLSALRRGRMPHFAAVTMEPRPYMLNLLGGGSGDVDCVYHLDLPALTLAIESVYGGKHDKSSRRTVGTFQRLVEQRRLRDYDELVDVAISL
ncbi:NgoMIV family type II restriction endonuclease [Isoptericola halotolerans]|uniref:NgoMIV family type II restriction endonuclease n=1 Tax=Isoptericola halotolerans TaxID=300560 RepID=UPI00388E051B